MTSITAFNYEHILEELEQKGLHYTVLAKSDGGFEAVIVLPSEALVFGEGDSAPEALRQAIQHYLHSRT